MSRPHRTRRLEIEASLPSEASGTEVMEYIRSPTTWPRWQSEILATRGPRTVNEGDVVDGDARLLGFDVTGRSSTTNVSAHSLEQDVIVGVRIRVSYDVAPAASGSVITHRMEADLPSGIAGDLLSLFLSWRLKKMQKSLLVALGGQAGGGQPEDARS